MIVTDTYSDLDMACPAEWENGFKEGRVLEFGSSERAASDPISGDWQGSTFQFSISDYDRRFREQLASITDRYWSEALTVRMTTRENRAALGEPYTVFVGPIIEAKPTRPLAFDITLGDIVSRGILANEDAQPWRVVRDGFIYSELTSIDEHLDRDAPEPIVYGIHKRVPDDDVASQFGFCLTPLLLGDMDVSGDAYHVWLVAGHACADVITIRVDGVEKISDEGTQWLVPHHSGHTAQFTNPYNDFTSTTYGNTRRYTLIFGKVTDVFADPDDLTDPDACALNKKQLTVAVEGIEPNGDGSGAVITDRIQQYKHFCINYVANRGPSSYQSGAWLANPTWDVFGATVEIVDEDSFDACSAIGVLRLPPDGYVGAAIVGAKPGEQDSVRRWIADWNRSCDVRFNITNLGRMHVFMTSPTQEIKDAAPLYTDATEMLDDTFDAVTAFGEQANRIPFKADYDHATGVWKTADTAVWDQAVVDYGREILGQDREYPFAPGITMSYHLARLEVLRVKDPVKRLAFETAVGPDEYGESLGYLDVGDYFRYRSFAGVNDNVESIRLAQIMRHQAQAGTRRVRVEAIDVDDFIGAGGAESYDRPPQESGAAGETTVPPNSTATPIDNSTAFDAIAIPPPSSAYELTVATSGRTTDASVPSFGTGPGIGYNPAWWKITPDSTRSMTFSTLGSSYDTQIAVFTADQDDPYGTMAEVAYNDNLAPSAQSLVTLSLTSGTTYYVLVAGYDAADGGTLRFNAVAPEVADLYVATTGRSGAAGSIDDPFRTFVEALDALALLGTGTIIARGGTYAETLVDVPLNGVDWSDKVRVAAFPGEIVWLKPPSSANYAIWLTGQNATQQYAEFDGINIDVSNCINGAVKGESAAGFEAKHIRLKNLTITSGTTTKVVADHWDWVTLQQSHNATTGDWQLLNVSLRGTAYGLDGLPSEGIYINQPGTIVDGCDVAIGGGNAFQLFSSGGYDVDGCTISRSRFSSTSPNPNDGSHRIILGQLNGGNVSGNVVKNCIVANVGGGGATLVRGLRLSGGATGNKFYNDTVYNVDGIGIEVTADAGASNEVKNCLAYLCDTNFDNSGGASTATNLTDGTDPDFVSAAAGDFRLQSTSPCIDAGTTLASVTDDFAGVPRPQNSIYDIGAHEYVAP